MKTNLFLFIYSILKAFLPFPSLEAILIPMCLMNPNHAFLYSVITGIGTCIGGHIGYELSARYGRKIVLKFVGEESIEKGIMEFQRLGYLFIVIGSISPFPDFILAYVAGLTKMNRLYFMLIDGGCRFIRSLILVYFSTLLNEFLHLDKYITIISILILVYFIMKMFFHKNK